ncbi:MAG: chemotaxis protein CheW [Candidatus Methanoperedens sp.]
MSKKEETVEQGLAQNPEGKKNILKARAIALARQPEDKKTYNEYIEIVEFMLAHEKYGLESKCVREVFPLKELTPVPGTPQFVLGIINVRGKILSVIDIKKFFELPEKGMTDLNRVIIIHNDQMEFGILADSIVGVRLIPLMEIQPSLPTLTGIRAEYLRGVTEDRLVILDVDKILSDKNIIIHEEG